MPRPFDHFKDRRRTDVYEDVSAYMQWGETFRGRFPALPNEGANYHFPEDYKLGYWDPGKTAWVSSQWEEFRDPSRLTYRSYIEAQSQSEQALESVLESSREANAFQRMEPEWVDALRGFFPSMRFAEWGVSMAHQFVGRFTISGLIANCAVLQSFDELRHTQRIAEVSRELDRTHGGFRNHREIWMEHERFQPLRQILELICVCRDWGEVVVATNVVLEPLLQPVLLSALRELGAPYSDAVLPHLAHSLAIDEERHTAWGVALAKMLGEESGENVEATAGWVEQWLPLAEAAVEPFAGVFESLGRGDLFEHAYEDARAAVSASLVELGVRPVEIVEDGSPA
jgi:hypothetical protein